MMKHLLIIGTLLLGSALLASDTMLNAIPYEIAKKDIGHGKAVLLEVGSDKCGSCQDMGRMLYRVKQSSPDALIYFINVWEEHAVIKTLKIALIPTQIVYDAKGKEAYRHIGLLTDDELNKILTQYKIR